jgi:hypothetical protein
MSKKRRLGYIGIAAAAFIAIYSAGAAVEMSEDEATKLKQEFMEQVEDIDAIGIFLNNFRIAAAMFIPAFGILVGMISAYSTGMVFTALVITTPQLVGIPPLAILATPFGAMELFSYGVAMSQSGILINAIIRKHNLRSMIRPIVIEFGIVAAVLLTSAFIEFYMIQTLGPEFEITQNV